MIMECKIYLLLLIVLILSSVQGATLYGWGKNDRGQLGIGSTADPIYSLTPISFYSSKSIKSLSLGENAHFVDTGNTYYSCGDNSDGQLGVGSTVATTLIPQLISDLTSEYEIYSLPKASIAYSASQKTVFGWGFAAGYIGGFTSGKYYRIQNILSNYGFTGFIDKIFTANGACFLQLSNGTIFVSGITETGVLGLGNSNTSPYFQKMTFWEDKQVDFRRIFTTQASSVCAQSANSSLFCWGSNNAGQLGLGHSENIYTPNLVPYFDDHKLIVSQLKQGTTHTIALTCGGRVFAWGANQRGQLGIGTSDLDLHLIPEEIISLRDKNIVEIITGANHNFARNASNVWFVWGMGDVGVLGFGQNNNINDVLAPTINPGFKNLGINHIQSGSFSQFAMGYNMANVYSTIQDCPENWKVDECNSISGQSPCGPNMHCEDRERGYDCICNPGYDNIDKDNACEDIDECLRNPCVTEANCENTNGSFVCDCPPGKIGDGLPNGTMCYPTVCGNGIVERGEECDTKLSPSCCTSDCLLRPIGYLCRNSTVPCDNTEYCNGTYQLCPEDDWSPEFKCDYCGNGECNNITETCTTCVTDCGTCDACSAILCNGKCVQSPIDCIIKCSKSNEFTCEDKRCVDDFTLCSTGKCINEEIECWDGSCQSTLSKCPLIPACPLLTKRCHGRCIHYNEMCDIEIDVNCTNIQERVCLNGKCGSACPEYNGCGTGFIRCPSGKCALDVKICKGDCPGDDEYLCGDGSCNLATNCSLLLRFEAAIPFTKNVPVGKDSTMTVVSSSGIPIVDLELAGGTFRNTTTISVTPVSFSYLSGIEPPAGWNGSGLESNIFSSAVAFEVPPKTKFNKEIVIAFSAPLPQGVNISEFCLGFINTTNQWDCASDVEVIDGIVYGKTPHFTPFAVIKKIKAPKFNALSRDDLDVFGKVSENSVIVYAYCGLFIVFSTLYAWAIHADRESKKRERKERDGILKTTGYEYEEEHRPAPRKREERGKREIKRETPSPLPGAIIHPISPSLSSPSSLSPSPALSSAPLINESVSPSSLSSLSSPSPYPSSPSPFANGELDIEEQREEREIKERQERKSRRTLVIRDAAHLRFTTKHKWLSIYFTARIENLSRVVRVTILLCMILTNMTVAAVFYNQENRSSVGQRIIVGVISSLISFVLSFAIFSMFKLVNKKYRSICYVISAVYVLGTGFLTLWYNLKLEQDTAYGWCVSSAIGITQDAVLNEPLKILVISLLIAFCPFLPYVDKL